MIMIDLACLVFSRPLPSCHGSQLEARFAAFMRKNCKFPGSPRFTAPPYFTAARVALPVMPPLGLLRLLLVLLC